MNIKKIFNEKALFVAGVLLVGSTGLTAFAQTYNYGPTVGTGVDVNVNATASAGIPGGGLNAGVTAQANLTALIGRAQTRADQEITRRIDALNGLSVRVNGMQRLSADEKSSLSATITAQIALMNSLRTKIAADAAANSTTSLKADIQSITLAYRVFILVIPQGAIAAASDRVMTVATTLSTLSAKLQTRITAAQTAGNDMSASVTLLADMNAKIADANAQSQAAVTETTSLQPDNGNATVQASNTAALKDARSKIQASQQDLITARADAGKIVKALISVSASATTP